MAEVPSVKAHILVEDFETELDDARSERAGDLTVGGGSRGDGRDGYRASCPRNCGGRPLRGADSAWQIVIRVIEDVVELGAELNFQALYRRRELLVEGQMSVW
jgi:hypothetical protein